MNHIHQLNEDIESCLLEIETNFPELYCVLEETPIKGINSNQPISIEDLEDYLNSLKAQLRTFQKSDIKNILKQ